MNFWKRLRVAIMPKESSRMKYIRKYNIFRELGEDVIFVPRLLPVEPEYIKIHNNVVVAARVTFITHDASHFVFNRMNSSQLKYFHGCIEVGNNVFIGANTTILPNVKIGDNTFIAAGAVVTKDIPGNGVYGGNPAKKIGDIETLFNKRKMMSLNPIDDVEWCWKNFNDNHGNVSSDLNENVCNH